MSEIIFNSDDFVRNFKGNIYRIVTIGTNSETGEKLVVYKSRTDNTNIWIKPYETFIKEFCKVNYSKLVEKYKFDEI